MTELTTFAEHARAMSTAEHKRECGVNLNAAFRGFRWVSPDPDCPGCVTEADRALWTQLADEYAAQLDRHREDALL